MSHFQEHHVSASEVIRRTVVISEQLLGNAERKIVFGTFFISITQEVRDDAKVVPNVPLTLLEIFACALSSSNDMSDS